MLQVTFSNRVERLYLHLKQALFAGSRPFTRRLVVVASPAMKSWLTLQLASDPELQVSAGIEIIYLDQGIERIVKRTGPSPLAKYELALLLEAQLKHLQKEGERPELTRYLRKPHRISAMAAKLAQLFNLYALYGKSMVRQWEEELADHWQADLWRRVSEKMQAWDLERFMPQGGDIQLHLFALSFISKRHHRLLEKLSKQMAIAYYLLSPCATFWSDLLSDRQRVRMEKKQRGIDLAAYESHPLLANWGRVGKEMARLVEEGQCMGHEDYLIPVSAADHPAYQQLLGDNLQLEMRPHPLTMLEALQADLLLHRIPNEKIALLPEDRSIQLHSASSKMREVEILSDQLVEILRKGEVEPRDILVMAPDITDYAPYIHAVLGGEAAPFDYQLIEVNLSAKQPLTQLFLQLIALAKSRWDLVSVWQIFEQPLFLERHGFGESDLSQLKGWMEASGARWGIDVEMRDRLLESSFCVRGMVERSNIGSWEEGFEQLIKGLVIGEGPVHVEASEAVLLGRWIELVRTLYRKLQPLSDGEERTLAEWVDYLEALMDRFLVVDRGDVEAQKLLHLFGRLRQLDEKEFFSFAALFFHLKEALEKQPLCFRDHQLQAVKFCSLLPMRTLPAQVVAFLGMDEGAFPRSSPNSSLNMLLHWPKADWYPSQTDYDRYLFLEGILSARRTLLISTSSETGRPSALVEELFNYLDETFQLGDRSPSQCCRYTHPFLPFDSRYFNGKLPCFSERYYRAASAFYQTNKADSTPFIASFALGACPLPMADRVVHLRELNSCARNPLDHYFRRTLGLYLETKTPLSVDESFQLSHLDQAMMKRAAVRHGFAAIVQDFRTAMPWGGFGQLAADRIKSEVDELKQHFSQWGVDPQELRSLALGDGPGQYAPLEIPYRRGTKVYIVGSLNEAAAQGLVTYQSEDRSGAAKVFPQFLVYCALVDREQLPFSKSLLFAKSGRQKAAYFDDPVPLLQRLLDSYFLSLEGPSPLLPEWIPYLLKGELKEMQEAHFYNEAAKWALRRGMPSQEDLLHFWKPYAESLYGELYSHWFPGRRQP